MAEPVGAVVAPEPVTPPPADPTLDNAALDAAALAQLEQSKLFADETPAAPAATEAVEPSTETAPAPTPPAAPAEDAVLQAKVAEFAAQQARAFQQQQELDAAKRAAEAKAEQAAAELAALKAQLKAKPLDVLKAEGWDLENLNKHAISGRTPEGALVQRLLDKVESLEAASQRAAQEAAAASERQAQQQAYQTLVSTTIPKALEPEAAKLPNLLAMYDAQEVHEMVYGVMAQEAERARANPGSGARIPTPSEAALKLEAQLSARLQRRTPTATGSQAPAEVKQPVAQPVVPKPGLTNATPPATPTKPAPSTDLSDDALNAAAREYLARNPMVA